MLCALVALRESTGAASLEGTYAGVPTAEIVWSVVHLPGRSPASAFSCSRDSLDGGGDPPEGASRYRVKFWQTMFSLMFHSSFMRDCVSHLSTNNIAFFLSHLRFDSRWGFVSICV